VYVIELSSGKSQLLTTVAGEVFSSPVVSERLLVVACRDNYVYCFDLGDETSQS